MSIPVIEYSREMGLTHDDFWRLLPRAMGEHVYETQGDNVHAKLYSGSLHIHLGPTQERRIASVCLPYSVVSFRFEDVEPAQQQAFKAYFDLRFQRGGG